MRVPHKWFGVFFAAGASVVVLTGCDQQADWRKPAAKEWPTAGGDWGNSRYSTLDKINTGNVKDLGAAWLHKFEDNERPVGAAIVSGGQMFITTNARVYALDPKTGESKWIHKPGAPIHGTYKGGAVGEGLVFVGLANARIIALKEATGEPVWEAAVGDGGAAKGQFIVAGPTYANGVVVAPLANGDFGNQGRVTGFDAKTGKQLWRFNTVPNAKDEPGYETWPQDQDEWKPGGGGVWSHPAYDPDLGLIYFGVGNPIPQWGGELRGGDNLFTDSAVALDAKTGAVKWHYQVIHHDIWEADLGTPVVLYDAMVDGKVRKALAVASTYGHIFMLDRATGKPVFPVEERPVPQNARLKTSPTQPVPVGAERIGPDCVPQDMIPVGFKGLCHFDPIDYDIPNAMYPILTTRAAPITYSPQTKHFYATAAVWPFWMRRFEDPKFFHAGPQVPGQKFAGILAAVDSQTHKLTWQKNVAYQTQQNGSGFISTAGGLLFRGNQGGLAEAYDAKSGEVLWQFQTGGNANHAASTYEVDGEQYVALASSTGLWAFKLGGKVEPLPAPPPPATETSFAGRIIEASEIIMAPTISDSGLEKVRTAVDEYAFAPIRAKVKVGTKVTWKNEGKETHDASAVDGSWTTGPIAPGKSASITFDKPGTHTYTDKEHPWSYAQLIVEE